MFSKLLEAVKVYYEQIQTKFISLKPKLKDKYILFSGSFEKKIVDRLVLTIISSSIIYMFDAPPYWVKWVLIAVTVIAQGDELYYDSRQVTSIISLKTQWIRENKYILFLGSFKKTIDWGLAVVVVSSFFCMIIKQPEQGTQWLKWVILSSTLTLLVHKPMYVKYIDLKKRVVEWWDAIDDEEEQGCYKVMGLWLLGLICYTIYGLVTGRWP